MHAGIRGLMFVLAGTFVMASAVADAGAAPAERLQFEGGFAGVEIPKAAGRDAVDFWTPERIARAKPLDGSFELGDVEPSPLARPVASKSVQVDPNGYPNRVHGKLLFQLPNGLPGFYSCSGTVTTSGSGSLITTAGHCVYDFDTKSVATGMVFIPGYAAGSAPYSVWPATNLIVTKRWASKRDAYNDDFAMVRVAPVFGVVQNLGSRGIGFNQPRKQHYVEYGYPAEGRPEYDGNKLIRCDSGYLPDPGRFGKPRGIGMRCDAEGGTSGGGWVSQNSFLVSASSHGYASIKGKLFGPYFGSKVKRMYKAKNAFWPSVGPIKCDGEVATIVGTNYQGQDQGDQRTRRHRDRRRQRQGRRPRRQRQDLRRRRPGQDQGRRRQGQARRRQGQGQVRQEAEGRQTARMRVALSTLTVAAALLAIAGTASAAPPGLTGEGNFLGPADPEPLSRTEAIDTWTPERLAAAQPLGLPNPSSPAPPRLAGSPVPETLKSMILRDPAGYPNRVHGKLAGTFEGLGDYTCSATVVTSGSGSLITTAGHCTYDVESRTVATNLVFVPGYSRNAFPYGIWPITHLIFDKRWSKEKLDYDYAMMRTGVSPFGSLQDAVGSRGIGFNQPRKQRLQAYGYPSRGKPNYNGDKLVLCQSGYIGDPYRNGGPQGRGMHCDQQEGSSGGGWVAKKKYVVSNTSHGYPRVSQNLFFGPYYGGAIKGMYKAKTDFWPSIEPIKKKGKVPDLIGPKRGPTG